jgi:hypothetical protein
VVANRPDRPLPPNVSPQPADLRRLDLVTVRCLEAARVDGVPVLRVGSGGGEATLRLHLDLPRISAGGRGEAVIQIDGGPADGPDCVRGTWAVTLEWRGGAWWPTGVRDRWDAFDHLPVGGGC